MDRPSKRPPRSTKKSRSVEIPPLGVPRLNDDEEDDGSRRTKTVALDLSAPGTATLTALTGSSAGRVFELSRDTTWIGRAKECEIGLSDDGISRRHASIVRTGNTFVVHDNVAKNGTWVNGRRATAIELSPGDEIQLGSNVSLVFTNAAENATRRAQQRRGREKALSGRMHAERLESLTQIVTRVAHQMNTPLGVATTANGMIVSLIAEIGKVATGPGLEELLADLRDSTSLMTRSLDRASRIVRTFTQLSSRQLTDERMTCDIGTLLKEVIEVAARDAKEYEVTRSWEDDDRFPWVGFPGHLSQVVNLILQNAFRHAYEPARGGRIDVRLSETSNGYQLEIEDYGQGVPSEVYPRIFEPFVTTAREQGGMGLGLAIAHNIVTNLLKGKITCETERGSRTRFEIQLPRLVPQVTELPPRP